jgi:hypothetical protein
MSSPERRQALPVRPEKFNQFSILSGPSEWAPPLPGAPKALTLQGTPSIRPAMAAGAIPPPLFFERRRPEGILAFESGILGNT